MSERKLHASEIGLDALGHLSLHSAWAGASNFDEVHHLVPAEILYVEPRRVLFWDAECDRPNSLQRFAYMLQLRAVAPLNELESYDESLKLALAHDGARQPSKKRLSTLHNLAARYQRDATERQRVTRLATSTARILFYYEPPMDADLKTLRDYLLEA